MRLIVKKPCSFGGRKFFIGNEVPAELVADPATQERLGVIAIVDADNKGVPDGQSGTFFTQEQVEKMVAEAVDEAVNNTVLEMEQKQKELQDAMGVLEVESFLSEGTVIIPVKRDSDGDNEQQMAVPATPEEVQQVFSIMQMNATDGAEAIAGVKSENVLILIHAADSRKTIKNAAKERADKISSTEGISTEAGNGNETTGPNTEGVDT